MKRFLKYFSITVVIVAVLGAAGATGLYFWAAKDLPRIKRIRDYQPPLTTTVYSSSGEVLGYLAKEKRFLRPLDEMSPHVPKAFLAAEDSSFYQHQGVDLIGIFRAAIKNIEAGSIVQGGSTITQQVIKSLLLTPERSYERKLKEAILAYRLEKYLSKKEILTIYLNEIYLGEGAYGVEAAARAYFGKHVSELNLAEAAMLAGLPKAPSHFNPYKHPERAQARQRYVLQQMHDLGWITSDQYSQALSRNLEIRHMKDPTWKIGAYYLEEVRRWLIDRFGEERTYTGGLQVHTAVDLEHQKAAERSVRKGLVASTKRRGWRGPVRHLPQDKRDGFEGKSDSPVQTLQDGDWIQVLVRSVEQGGANVSFGNQTGRIDVKTMSWCRKPDPSKAPEDVPPVRDAREVLEVGDVVWASLREGKQDERGRWKLSLEQKPRVEGALVSLDPENGMVRALVGGYSFHRSQFNRATQAKRQTGSAFKPIVYSAALDNGFTTASMLLDAPIVYTDQSTNSTWKPENYERVSFGPTLLRTALVKSRNLVTIRVARQIGIDTVIQRAKTLGLEAEFPRDLSVSLGSGSVSLMNLCQAYSGFARGGSIIEPRLVRTVKNSWGEELYASEKRSKSAISGKTAYIITYLMQQVVQHGTGWRVKALGRPVAGKTGTTDEHRDAWFMGFTPYLLTGVYVGFDEPKPMGKYETGSRAAAPLWIGYRKAVEDQYPVQDFERPSGIVMARVDAKNGMLAGPGTDKSYLVPFKVGTQPTEISTAGVQQAGASGEPSSDDGGGGSGSGDMLKQIF
jgi:penicillin-binding protein 1A